MGHVAGVTEGLVSAGLRCLEGALGVFLGRASWLKGLAAAGAWATGAAGDAWGYDSDFGHGVLSLESVTAQ